MWLVRITYFKIFLINFRVEDFMNHLGWKRIKEKTDDNCKLRWCELKSTIDYERFIEGM